MTITDTKKAAEIIVNEAFIFMAKKADVSVEEIKTYILNSEVGAKYFASLVMGAAEMLEAE